MRYKRFVVIPVLLAIMMFFFGCATPKVPKEDSDMINVTIADGEQYYLRKNTFAIHRGENVVGVLIFRNDYIPDGCSYENYELIKVSSNEYRLTLFNVRYPEFVTVGVTNGNEAIRYYANGGEYIGDRPVEGYIKGEISKTHLRTNTDLGHSIRREGFVLTGWNESADGRGKHIGLGSRVSLKEDGVTELYAHWEKTIDEKFIEYERVENGIALTAYTGEKRTFALVLPEQIDGVPVVEIKPGFCTSVSAKLTVIPRSITTIRPGAFTGLSTEELYIFDTMYDASDESFVDCKIGQVRINAASNPRYQDNTEIAYFADAIDRLEEIKDKKKLIFFSGCSFSYGINSETVAREVGDEFRVINLGVIGGTNAGFQFDIISNFVGEGDVLIHAPEEASPYQLMASNRAEIRMFVITEGNYDLLSLVDISSIDGFFTNFSEYCKNRTQLEPGDYDGFSGAYNSFGDIIKPRRFTGEDKSFTEDFGYSFHPEFINEQSAKTLCDYYAKLQARGAQVAISFSPINFHGLPPADREGRIWEQFENNMVKYLFEQNGIKIISSVTDYIFEGRYFYDTDYHLNDEGVKIRTARLLRDMKDHGIYGAKQ